MAIKCTYGDIDCLRDLPNRPGPLSKLMASTEASIVDKFRFVRLSRAVEVEIGNYVKALAELGRAYGTEVQVAGMVSWQIKPEHQAEFKAKREELDAITCDLLINPLPITSLEKIGTLTAADIALLGPFVEQPDDLK